MFIIAQIEFADGAELEATVAQTELEKCPRCWNHRELGKDAAHEEVCERCASVLEQLGA